MEYISKSYSSYMFDRKMLLPNNTMYYNIVSGLNENVSPVSQLQT